VKQVVRIFINFDAEFKREKIMKAIKLLLMMLLASVLNAQNDVITFDVGNATVTLLSEGQRQGGTGVLVGATPEMIKQAIPEGAYPSATNVFLIETEKNTILVDAGLGPKTPANLELYGKKADAIDAILITHFHGDHIGSLLANNEKCYPKATLFIAKPEYDYYMDDTAMNGLPENRRGSFAAARKIFDTYKDRLNIFTPGEMEGATELLPGIRGVAAYGHTPGHAIYLLESEGSKILFWGDVTHAMAIQMPFPEVAMTYDYDTAKAIETRGKLLKYVSDNRIRVAGAHIEFPGICDIRKNAAGGYTHTLLCNCEGKFPSPL
jgi:glyoxylase-like metal-dependent hydrolase (beta-lactamase superfamily II)